MSLSLILKQLRKKRGWTQDELAAKSGVKRHSIAQVEIGKGGFAPENQKLIADALEVDFTMLDFVKSSGSSLSSDKDGNASHSAADKVQLFLSELLEKDAELYVPYYDVEITAGRIELYFDDVDELPEGYIYAPQYRDCIACNVKGDSMYDRIYPGSRLYVYHLSNRKYIDYGQIYLVVLEGYRLLKYIHPHPEDDSKVRLSSYNKHYSHWDIDRADILNLFIVKGYENQNAM